MPGTPPIEALIPHRRGMRLIDTIVAVDAGHAVARATVQPHWPLQQADGVDPLVLIELAAQTAGICFGWNEQLKPEEQRRPARGWLVGVKAARFHSGCLSLGACVTIRAENRLAADLYKEIAATATIDGVRVGEVHLQVLQAEDSPFRGVSDS